MIAPIRHVDIDPAAPVSTWPYEAIVTLIERGTIGDWARLTRDIADDPWGPVARQAEEYLDDTSPPGVGPLMRRAIERARREQQVDERAAVAATVARLVDRSGLTMSDFASRIGTSRSRLSTYRSGRVVPSATLLVRMERLVARLTRPPG